MPHTIATPYGLFSFGWHRMPGDRKKPTWIWGKFHEPKRARGKFACNQFTGKWNYFPVLGYSPLQQLINDINEMRKETK